MATLLWFRLLREAEIYRVYTRSCYSILVQYYLSFGDGTIGKIGWRCDVLATFWAIWLERNGSMFEGRFQCSMKVTFLFGTVF